MLIMIHTLFVGCCWDFDENSVARVVIFGEFVRRNYVDSTKGLGSSTRCDNFGFAKVS